MEQSQKSALLILGVNNDNITEKIKMHDSKLRLFLSYSFTKSADPQLTNNLIDLLSEIIQSRPDKDLEMVDAMEPDVGSISKKVEKKLRSSHALVAEATTSSPNVMFELGFARANGLPIIIFMNPDAFNPASHLQSYFEFIGADLKKPLPADLGDIEFIKYKSEDINTPGGKLNFKKIINDVLDKLRKRMPTGMRLLIEGTNKLRLKAHELRSTMEVTEDPPLLRLLGGWLDQVIDELGDAGVSGFLVDSKYYSSCFSQFTINERQGGRAIADLTDPTEQLWIASPVDDVQMTVDERIFLFDGMVFYKPEGLEKLFQGIKRHIEKADNPNYRVLIAASDNRNLPKRHPFSKSKSRDILLIGPDLVGGYERHMDRDYLRIVRSKTDFDVATTYYQQIKKCAFEFDPNWTNQSLFRAEWLDRENIGKWDPSWTYDFRDEHYYSLYDLHIRSWVPEYEGLIESTAAIVIEKLKELTLGNPDRQRVVLEIGCGTGTLSLMVLKEISFAYSDQALAHTYICVDRAKEMIARTNASIKAADFQIGFRIFKGTAFDGLPGELIKNDRYSVICGSLVLSHILKQNVEVNLRSSLDLCRNLLVQDGVVIFTDTLVEDPDKMESCKGYWREGMIRQGLSPQRVDDFLEHNKEMLSTVTRDQVLRIGKECGFNEISIRMIPGSIYQSPFRIIVMS